MRKVAFTFDDGRNDNYNFAFRIMLKYGLVGTIFCTTGFIDGTWKKKKDWLSAEKALSIRQLEELKVHGWEIGIHGDKHITEKSDAIVAITKMKKWGLLSSNEAIGFSLPDSRVDSSLYNEFSSQLYPDSIKYIRHGRKTNTRSIFNKALFFMYTYFGFNHAYKLFNSRNLVYQNNVKKDDIPSVVVRFKDKPKMLIRFISKMPDNTCIVLMFHSILPNNSDYYGKDPWNWDTDRFDCFCREINSMRESGFIEVLPLEEFVKE